MIVLVFAAKLFSIVPPLLAADLHSQNYPIINKWKQQHRQEVLLLGKKHPKRHIISPHFLITIR